ncbi:MAG: hypothetical protein KDC05_04115, partial [Bacteroidales bacterium]|nr:hypothetical protein [Bacteroidales bacterium]
MNFRIYLTIIALFALFNFNPLNAQAPQKMSYQAVIRDAEGQLLIDSEVGIRITILQGTASGTSVFIETHTPQTNASGLVSLEIGDGNTVSGNLDEIDWSDGPYFIKTETDPEGGTNYTITGTSQFLSVPYALYAEESGTPGPEGPQGEPGDDGVGIENAEVIGDSLYVTLTNGETLTAGFVTGPQGPQGIPGDDGDDGIGINYAEVVDDSLYVSLTNGETITAGYVTGPQGLPGADGNDGIGITSAEVIGDSLYITLSSGETLTAGYVTGLQGMSGEDGDDGIGIDTTEVIGDSLYVVLSSGETLNAGYVTGPQGPQGVAPDGNDPGDMLFWDGDEWQFVPIGNPGQILQINTEGVPEWSGVGYATIQTDDATNISPASATVGGEVISDGGSEVTSRGIVFSLNPFPTFNDSIIESGSGTGSFTIDLTGLQIGQTYYVRAFATNEIGTMFGNQVSFQTNSSYMIGDAGPAGGIVFYDKGSYSNGWRYLEAAPTDQSSFPGVSAGWGCNGTLIPNANNFDIGYGFENTESILNNCGSAGIAARKAADYSLNGFDDWFLPSNGELQLVYNNLYLNGLGNLNGIATYWSSTQNNSTSAQARNFNSGGGVIHQSKTYQYYHV